MSRRTVNEVMTTDVATVHPDTPYKEIARLLADRNISAVPVVDADHRVLGVVSEADLMHKVEFSGESNGVRLFQRHRTARHKASGDIAQELMSSPAVCVQANATVVRAARVMDSEDIKRLPVLDDDHRLIGIVSRRDLIRPYTRSDAEIHKEIVNQVIRRMLALDPATVTVEVTDGIVTVSGEVETKSLAGITVHLIQSVDGVVDVGNHLTYRSDDTEMIAKGRRATGW